MRTGIKITIKQQEYFLNNVSYNNTYNKINYTQRGRIIVYNSKSKDNNYSYNPSFNKKKYKLPLEADNSIKIFWYDIFN